MDSQQFECRNHPVKKSNWNTTQLRGSESRVLFLPRHWPVRVNIGESSGRAAGRRERRLCVREQAEGTADAGCGAKDRSPRRTACGHWAFPSTRTCSVMRPDTSLPTTGRTRGQSNNTSGTAISSTQHATPIWPRSDSMISGSCAVFKTAHYRIFRGIDLLNEARSQLIG